MFSGGGGAEPYFVILSCIFKKLDLSRVQGGGVQMPRTPLNPRMGNKERLKVLLWVIKFIDV